MSKNSKAKRDRRVREKRKANARRLHARRAEPGLDVSAVFTGRTVSVTLPPEETARILEAKAKAEPWFRELSAAQGRPNRVYRPKVKVFGGPGGAWRWMLDLSGEASLVSGAAEAVGACIEQFGNAPYRRVIEADSSETFFVGNEVASRANKAGAEFLPLATDEELGIVRIKDGIHCTCCLDVFSKSEDHDSTGLCAPCREGHGHAATKDLEGASS